MLVLKNSSKCFQTCFKHMSKCMLKSEQQPLSIYNTLLSHSQLWHVMPTLKDQLLLNVYFQENSPCENCKMHYNEPVEYMCQYHHTQEQCSRYLLLAVSLPIWLDYFLIITIYTLLHFILHPIQYVVLQHYLMPTIGMFGSQFILHGPSQNVMKN